ncbi:TetR/AcrR family transcriptional regulator [Sorangium sp. So ce321]|uniref:TetR/AcrR family transcriptional regulator n=1 Tax=Sorangium sp. So ce321 TaxID=3133300 RepID=UPI003F5D927B
MARDASGTGETIPGLVWMRERPAGPSRARMAEIVAAAIRIADAEGLEALSMRRLAEAVNAGAMSLYRYVANKDELIELMVDAVLVESEVPAGASGDWRVDLGLVARQEREVMLRHPWLAQQLASRPSLGPNAVRKVEFALEAALSMGVDITTAGAVLATVMSFVHGSVLAELAEAEAQRRTDLSEAQWRAAVAPYVRKIIEEGRHPQFARRVLDAEDLDSEAQFAFGLDCLLDGLAARRAPAPRPTRARHPASGREAATRKRAQK